ncbi:DUF982 domain-containing protein [Pararhizobium sp. BT-229]|uniref:DUF982 domain-containing protein n=1 Tax=Pararhizobium sp. BT-229 TaxID=2986923 RepID=UPI0035561C48
MKPDMFERPVNILTGLGHPALVGSVIHAYELLVDWPYSGRDTTHILALNACRAALNGEIEPETARIAFIAFAEKHHLLAPGTEALFAKDLPHDGDQASTCGTIGETLLSAVETPKRPSEADVSAPPRCFIRPGIFLGDVINQRNVVYAVGLRKAVVSHPYWHAGDLLGDGTGALVPFANAGALAMTIGDFLSDHRKRDRVRRSAYRASRRMETWRFRNCTLSPRLARRASFRRWPRPRALGARTRGRRDE